MITPERLDELSRAGEYRAGNSAGILGSMTGLEVCELVRAYRENAQLREDINGMIEAAHDRSIKMEQLRAELEAARAEVQRLGGKS